MMPKTTTETLREMGEFFAAGFFEEPDASPVVRWSRAVRRELENRAVLPYDGGPLYPCGPASGSVEDEAPRMLGPDLVSTWWLSESARDAKLADATEQQRLAIEELSSAINDLHTKLNVSSTPHTVGGHGYIHSIPNYGRVVNEGFDGHVRRIKAALARARRAGDSDKVEFELGLIDVIEGLRVWHGNIVNYLTGWTPEDTVGQENRDRILQALAQVPFKPVRTFFEALLSYNFTFYLDYCDNPGRIDQVLWPFYQRDLSQGRISRGEVVGMMSAFTDFCCDNESWSTAIGGTTPDGEPAYNDLTLICLETVRGKHRPNYQLHIRRDMPQEVWDAAFDALATGCGQPALYNEEGFYKSLSDADLGLTKEDLALWNGGGCTETMVQGLSNVGSLDAGFNLPLILDGVLKEHLPTAESFDALLDTYKNETASVIEDVTAGLNRLFKARAAVNPHPIRSLLVDDCIENGRDFQAGGARYNWSVVNIAGLANVVDSFAAIREVVFEKAEKTGGELADALERNFKGDETLQQRLMRCPKFGNDLPEVDELAADLGEFIFKELRRHKTVRGGRFLPSCLMFVTYVDAGKPVGATPDGRGAGEPLADSMGPVAGRDTHGPTAMLKSVTQLPLHLATGTPIINIRFSKSIFTNAENRKRLRDLIKAYFEMGGLQLQANVVDYEVLCDAIAHPERHGDLIVRVGGYCAHFNTLGEDLKRTILERTEHNV